jgi:hypothetical protein
MQHFCAGPHIDDVEQPIATRHAPSSLHVSPFASACGTHFASPVATFSQQ